MLLVRIPNHDVDFVGGLFIIYVLMNALNVNGVSPTQLSDDYHQRTQDPNSMLCVEPSPVWTDNPTVQIPEAPFNEGPQVPFNENPNKPPFYEGPHAPSNESPAIPPKPPFNEGPIISPKPPFNESPNPPCKEGNPTKVKLENVSPGGDFGIKFSYDAEVDRQMNILISYDTETTPAASFFKEQFTTCVFQGFSKCGVIKWDIMPCFRSKMKGGKLWCPGGDKQCEFDKIHACVATLYINDPQKIGMFVICFFTQGNNAQLCATNNGLNYDDIWKCASGNEGASNCDECYRHIHGKPPQKDDLIVTPGIIDPVDGGGGIPPGIPHPVGGEVHAMGTPNSVGNLAGQDDLSYPDVINGSQGDSKLNAITDFKGAVCAKLNEGKLKCDFCFS